MRGERWRGASPHSLPTRRNGFFSLWKPDFDLARANHQGNFIWERTVRQVVMVDPKWLGRIAEGRPGICGPRFPRSWSRTDFCPG